MKTFEQKTIDGSIFHRENISTADGYVIPTVKIYHDTNGAESINIFAQSNSSSAIDLAVIYFDELKNVMGVKPLVTLPTFNDGSIYYGSPVNVSCMSAKYIMVAVPTVETSQIIDIKVFNEFHDTSYKIETGGNKNY